MKLTIDVNPDSITIEDYTVPRPNKIAPKQWEEFWARLDDAYIERLKKEAYDAGWYASA